MTGADLSLRVAAVLGAFSGPGLPAIYGMKSIADGNGVPLLAAFLAVCAAHAVAAAFVSAGHAVGGGWLGLALIVPGAPFGWGFDLPIRPFLAGVWSLPLWYGWDALR